MVARVARGRTTACRKARKRSCKACQIGQFHKKALFVPRRGFDNVFSSGPRRLKSLAPDTLVRLAVERARRRKTAPQNRRQILTRLCFSSRCQAIASALGRLLIRSSLTPAIGLSIQPKSVPSVSPPLPD